MEPRKKLKRWIKKKIKNTTKEEKIVVGVTLIGIVMAILTLMLLPGQEIFQFMFIGSVLIAAFPFAMYQYWLYMRVSKIEKHLPDYLRDVSESIKAGVTLPRAIEMSTRGIYGPLSEEMDKTAAQISWGVPFEEAMRKFGERSNSPLAKRAVTIIIETYNSGGDIAEILETVGKDLKTLKKLRERRRSKLKTYTYTTYFIFFIFLGIMALLTVSFVPATPDLNKAAHMMGGTPTEISPTEFKNFFFHLAMIQAFFAGMIAGQMGTGKIIAGVKHAAILLAVTLITFQLILAPPGFTESVASEIVKIPPGTQGIESGTLIITLSQTVETSDIARATRELAEEQEIRGYSQLRGENIVFMARECIPCQDGRLIVDPDMIQVNQRSEVQVRVVSQRDGGFRVELGGTPMQTGIGG